VDAACVHPHLGAKVIVDPVIRVGLRGDIGGVLGTVQGALAGRRLAVLPGCLKRRFCCFPPLSVSEKAIDIIKLNSEHSGPSGI